MVLYYPTLFRASEAKIESERGMCMIPVEAIERVIDDIETRIDELKKEASFMSSILMIEVYRSVIRELQKVVDDYGTSKP